MEDWKPSKSTNKSTKGIASDQEEGFREATLQERKFGKKKKKRGGTASSASVGRPYVLKKENHTPVGLSDQSDSDHIKGERKEKTVKKKKKKTSRLKD